jgi:hypothetical protein
MDFYHHLYSQSSKPFDQVSKPLKEQFQNFGITKKHWEVIRQADLHTAPNGAKYVNPLNVYKMDHPLAS